MRTARYRHDDDYFYPNVVAASSDVAAVSDGGGGRFVTIRLKTYARLGLLYGSVFVSGAMLGAMLTFFICTSTFAADVTRNAAAAALHDDDVRNLLRDCYDDAVVENHFYCSLNEDTARRCRNERSMALPTFPKISKTDRDDEIERLSFADDYAYSTFGPAVAFTDSSESSVKRKVYDIRLRLARIACATKNLLIVLTATTA